MKKTIFSIAIAAISSLALVSCTGTAEGNEQNDSTKVEQTEEQAEIPIKELKELECDDYLLKVPEGWQANSRMVNSSCVLGFMEAPFTTCSANAHQTTNLDSYKADIEKQGGKALEDITVGERTYVVYEKPDQDGKPEIYLATARGEGIVTLRLFNGASQMEEAAAKEVLMNNVKTMVESITVK